jgi:uncharacterized delta-60 repeat protein
VLADARQKQLMRDKSNSGSWFFSLRILISSVVFFAGISPEIFVAAKPRTSSREAAESLGVRTAGIARYNGPGNSSNQAKAIAVDSLGDVYVTGGSVGLSGDLDYTTIKYSAGRELWVARYNGPGSADDAEAIAIDNAGNVYVTGWSYASPNSSNTDYATIKYNSAGEQQWVARYNGPGDGFDEATAIAIDGSGNVYVTGDSWGSAGNLDYATIKYNSAGEQQWVASYSGPGSYADVATAIAVDNSGNVYVTGYSAGLSGNFDYATIKYNSAGEQHWVARYNGPRNNDDSAYGIAVDSSGNVYVTGYSGAGPTTGFDYATLKYNSVGEQQWIARYSGPGNQADEAAAIIVDDSDNVYVTGESLNSEANLDYATIKYNSFGQQQWAARYNGPANRHDAAHAIAVDSSENVYVTGFSEGLSTNSDYATIKYNSSGEQQWVARYNGPANDYDEATAIVLDGSGNVYVTGRSWGSGGNFDYATIKYQQIQLPPPRPTPVP